MRNFRFSIASMSFLLTINGLTIHGHELSSMASAQPANNGQGATLAATPPMGWNYWAHYAQTPDQITGEMVFRNASGLVKTGLAGKGYKYINLDDLWMASTRKDGQLAPASTFSADIASLIQKIHSLHLNFGIYEDAGYETCGLRPGSGMSATGGSDHFSVDMATFANWGVDYVKLDGCHLYGSPGQTAQQIFQTAYSSASNAIAKSSNPQMVFSESAPAYFYHDEGYVGGGEKDVTNWFGTPDWYAVLGWAVDYGQLWREGSDIALYSSAKNPPSRWSSVMKNYQYNRWLQRYAGPGHWNDPDFIIAGDAGLTADEGRSQFALWAMMAAPLILSLDLTPFNPSSAPTAPPPSPLLIQAVADLGNTDIIAIDQDPLGNQGYVISTGSNDKLIRVLSDGDFAFAVLNKGSNSETVSTSFSDLGASLGKDCSYTIKDLHSGALIPYDSSLGVITSSNLPPHGVAIYRISPTPGSSCTPLTRTGVIGGYNPDLSGNNATCVTDVDDVTTDGNPIALSACVGDTPRQIWTVGSDGTVRNNGKCLTEQGPQSATGGYSVVLSTCKGLTGQRWTYQHNGQLVSNVSYGPNSQQRCLQAPYAQQTPTTQPTLTNNGLLATATCASTNQLDQIWSLPGNWSLADPYMAEDRR